MKYLKIVVILFVAYSCSNKNQTKPINLFESVPANYVEILGLPAKNTTLDDHFMEVDSIALSNIPDTLESLEKQVNQYKSTGEKEYLKSIGPLWGQLKEDAKPISSSMDKNVFEQWFHINLSLLKLSGEARYAEAIDDILNSNNHNLPGDLRKEWLSQAIYTMDADHVYINLFTPSTLKYTHSLGGNVTITQETGYPKENTVAVKFGMDIKRYMEIYIRVPSWVAHSEVTVKKVKYFTAPGTYCKIAKKWKDGDVIKVSFKK